MNAERIVIICAFVVWGLWELRKIKEDRRRKEAILTSQLKRAQEAVAALRAGYHVSSLGEKIYLDPGFFGIHNLNVDIALALDAGLSYEKIGTTEQEVMGFRKGEAHKTSARLQLTLSRTLEKRPRKDEIIELAEKGGFTLEEIGTSHEELQSLTREYYRRSWKESIDRFRQGTSSKNCDKFEEDLARLLSNGFSYEDLGTSQAECEEMIQRGRRREVEQSIEHLRWSAKRGSSSLIDVRGLIKKALEKGRLTLADFNLTEADLDEIEQNAHVFKDRKVST